MRRLGFLLHSLLEVRSFQPYSMIEVKHGEGYHFDGYDHYGDQRRDGVSIERPRTRDTGVGVAHEE